MLSKTKLKMLLGAAAVGAAGHALAQTNAGTGGTIWLTVDDISTGSSYVFDTGLKVSSFAAFDFASYTLEGANWTSFLASIDGDSLTSTTDLIQYEIIGGSAASTTSPVTLDFTGTGSQSAVTGTKAGYAYTQINTFLANRDNPGSSDSFEPAGSPTEDGWYVGGYDSNFNNDVSNTDHSAPGTPMDFYQTTNATQHNPIDVGEYSLLDVAELASSNGTTTLTLGINLILTPLPGSLPLLLGGILAVIGLLRPRRLT